MLTDVQAYCLKFFICLFQHLQLLTPALMKKTNEEFKQIHRTRYHFYNGQDNY